MKEESNFGMSSSVIISHDKKNLSGELPTLELQRSIATCVAHILRNYRAKELVATFFWEAISVKDTKVEREFNYQIEPVLYVAPSFRLL